MKCILSFITHQDKTDTYGTQNIGYIPITVNVLDLDDRSPVFEHTSYMATVEEDTTGVVDVQPQNISATDGDTLNAPIVYTMGKFR